MDVALRILVQWLHVTSGVLWIGGGFYVIFVQLPALASLPLPARGPALAAFAPRQIAYILRVAELTLATGILQIFVSGRGQQLTAPLESRWAIAILLGLVLAFGLYGSVHRLAKPLAERMLALGPKAAAGDASAAAEIPALRERIQRVGYAQLAVGLVILIAMVTARFS